MQGGKKSDLQAFESRLLNRGSDVDPSKSTAANTETLVKLGEKQRELLEKAVNALQTTENTADKKTEIKYEVIKA